MSRRLQRRKQNLHVETEKTQESKRLMASVKEKYNDPGELELRLEELKIGLREEERAFVENCPADGRLLDVGCATGRLCFALASLDTTSPVSISPKSRLSKHGKLLKRSASTWYFNNMQCRGDFPTCQYRVRRIFFRV